MSQNLSSAAVMMGGFNRVNELILESILKSHLCVSDITKVYC